MQTYVCKVDALSASDPNPAGDGYYWPNQLTFKAETAKKVGFTNHGGANYIDSNLYAEDGTTYLLVKKDGLIEQIYRSKTPDDPNSWQPVNERASWGYEGVSINKANGTYYLYGDGVNRTKPLGIRMVTSNSITRGDEWVDSRSTAADRLYAPTFTGENGNTMPARHGDVITLRAGTQEWRTAKALLDPKVSQYEGPFDDVPASSTFAGVIREAKDNGWVSGYGNGSFGPDGTVTREQAASFIFKYDGGRTLPMYWNNKDASYDTGFFDVNAAGWSASAIAWARNADVIHGTSPTTFAPLVDVSREQFAVMLANYSKKHGASDAAGRGVLSRFPDASGVDDWAEDSVAWCVQNHIMGNGGSLNAQSAITRAEAAAMISNTNRALVR